MKQLFTLAQFEYLWSFRMLSLVVPSKNRLHTLQIVAESFYKQADVSEIVFVLDGCTDRSRDFILSKSAKFPTKKTIIIENEASQGAAACRMIGIKAASCEYILFCDDDLFLEDDYGRTCLRKIRETNSSIASGAIYIVKRVNHSQMR